jgi:GNAT superfamily N-acetyltransferase
MTKKKVTIRLAERADVDQLVQMWVDLMNLTAEVNLHYRLRPGADELQHAMFVELLKRSDSFVIVACAGPNLIGFANGYFAYPSKVFAQSTIGVIENLFVVEPWRRRGIGKELVDRAMAWLKHFGAMELHVNVVPKNVASLKFWRAMEFQVHRVAMVKEP